MFSFTLISFCNLLCSHRISSLTKPSREAGPNIFGTTDRFHGRLTSLPRHATGGGAQANFLEAMFLTAQGPVPLAVWGALLQRTGIVLREVLPLLIDFRRRKSRKNVCKEKGYLKMYYNGILQVRYIRLFTDFSLPHFE